MSDNATTDLSIDQRLALKTAATRLENGKTGINEITGVMRQRRP